MTLIDMIALMLFCHAIADYPLQGDFLARAKSRIAPVAGVDWWIVMTAHCAIHAGFVGMLTGSLAFGICEFVAHFAIDDAKCRGAISFRTDQALHVACKVAYVIVIVFAEGTH